MKTYRLALIGFGNVGQGLAQILHDHDYSAQFGAHFEIVAVNTLSRGSIYNPDGITPAALLSAMQSDGHLRNIDVPHTDWSAMSTILESNADIVVESSFTNLETAEPALNHIMTAIEQGKHVVTANKGPVALHYDKIKRQAALKNVLFRAEGTVMSGTPALALGSEQLAAAGITRVQGILNGTTNYMLSLMEGGATYEDALSDAQAQGYAEADPTGDVEGFDVAGKILILANMLMDTRLSMADIDREGITKISPSAIAQAAQDGYRWKLIGTLEKTDNGVKASVKPTRLPISHPLASVGGATNAITFSTQLMGDITLIGAGAGRIETGYGLLSDLLAIHRLISTN